MSLKLTLLSLVVAPLLTLALQPMLRRLRRGYRRLRNEYGEIDERTPGSRQRHSSGEVVRRRSVRGSPLRRREPPLLRGHGARSTVFAALSQPLTEIIGTSIAVLILWIGAQEVSEPTPDTRRARRSSCS